jgi:hypothetical protein
MAGRLFAKFGGKADRALVEHRIVMLELGDAINVVMCIVQVFITGMAETLVPE